MGSLDRDDIVFLRRDVERLSRERDAALAEVDRLTRELEALYDACAVRGVNLLEGRWFTPIFGFEASPKPFRERAPYYPSREACLEAVRRAVSESMEGKP